MFVPTSPQRGLFETESLLSDKGRALLKRSWAETFAREVLPRLLELEPQLQPLYSDTGRPNWSAARMLGLLLLRELMGLGSDRELVESLAFDARFQHALGLSPDEAYLSRRSLVDFRRRFQAHSGEMLAREVFNEVTATAISSLGLSTATQRIDSTFVESNIAIRGRTALLLEGLEKLLNALGPERRERLTAELRSWDGEHDGWDSKANFKHVAHWLQSVLKEFEADGEVSSWDIYQLTKALFAQHVRITTATQANDDNDEPPPASSSTKPRPQNRKKNARGKDKTQRRARRKQRTKAKVEDMSPSTLEEDGCTLEPDTSRGVDRIQSLHDTDARLGHKGIGHLVQITETCGNTGVEFITGVSVGPANTSDMTELMPMVESLQACGRKPQRILSDAGYVSAANMMECAAAGIELYGPVRRPARRAKGLDRGNFTYDESGDVIACPEGHAPTRHALVLSASNPEAQRHAFFDGSRCSECPSRADCPVVDSRKKTRISIAEGIRARDARLREQKTPEFREHYAMRSGIEATNSELKRAHSLDRFTVRGAAKIEVRTIFKVTACNIKRLHRAISLKAA